MKEVVYFVCVDCESKSAAIYCWFDMLFTQTGRRSSNCNEYAGGLQVHAPPPTPAAHHIPAADQAHLHSLHPAHCLGWLRPISVMGNYCVLRYTFTLRGGGGRRGFN